MAAAALDALVGSRPGDWLTQRGESGSRMLHTLHQQCSAAGLTPQSTAQDDVATLHALFDVALEQGLGELLVDYVVEVCSDPFLTSADPVDAYLMDGRCVQQWAHRALRSSRARLLQALQQEGLAAQGTAVVLAAVAGRLQSLDLVLRALADPAAPADQPPSEGADDLAEVQRLRQAAAAATWAATAAGGGGGRRWGAFASHAEWRGVANRRRDAAAPQRLLLAGLLQALRESGQPEVPAYPFSSPEQAVELFVAGSPGAEAWRSKLALLVYACMDAGYDIDADALGHAFDVGPADAVGWQAAFWLDDAARGAEAAEHLERACRQLPGVAGPATPFAVVEALAARGAPAAALAVQRCRGAPPGDLPQAQALLGVRLSEGLLTDAVVEVQRFLSSSAGDGGEAAADALAQQLAEWAADNGQMQALSEMPLPAALENSLLGWLTQSAMAGRVPGAQLPLFLLQRGALAAAVAASAALDQALAQGGLQEDEEVTRQRRAIVATARRLLPTGAAPAASFQLPLSRLEQAPAVRAASGGDADMDVGASQEGTAPGSSPATRFSARLGWAAASGPGNNGTPQTPDIEPAAFSDGTAPASGRRGASARNMQAEWGDAMGLAPRSGPRTRQATKRQKTVAARR